MTHYSHIAAFYAAKRHARSELYAWASSGLCRLAVTYVLFNA
jgi:hypothetical protein